MHWWGRGLLVVAGAWILLLAVRCHLPRHLDDRRAASPDSTSAIYLIQHGWHAGIAVRRADLPDDAWPVLDTFPDATYLEVGWGEARYYPDRARGIWGAVRAGGWPTASVLHVVPITDSVPERFPAQTIVRIPVDTTSLTALVEYVGDSFAAAGDSTSRPVAPGFYSDSHFFRSKLHYHVFNNCNHWAAGALEAAGCDTAPRWTLTVGQVVRQARDCGMLLRRRSDE